uniref:VWFA domain-containing protein n=1 Tax=Plectus sambesii TaxID=2011161 RepID=A0A914XDL1_9BILA
MKLWFTGVVLAVLATATSAQKSTNITACAAPCNLGTTPADVLIFIDTSNGMGQTNLEMLRVAIVDYAVYATSHGLLVENHNNHAELVNLINDVKLRGYDNRNIYLALLEGSINLNANAGMRAGVPKIGIIFSAAAFARPTNPNSQDAQAFLKNYTNAGFVFYGLGVGPNANNNELATFIGQPNNVFPFINAERLNFVVGWLLSKSW